MKNFTLLLFSALGLVSFNKIEAKTVNTSIYEYASNPVKKKTAVIAESKDVDAKIQAELDALLGDFIEETKVARSEGYGNLSGQILSTAFDYEGVRYRFGGMSRKGMDCSGLVMTAFGDTSINLPRSSSEMAQVGEKVRKSEAQIGDLIFFKTRGNRISHVGIITEVLGDEIKFIHSSTSRGVIVSSTKENYYQRTFAQINRVLTEIDS